MNRKIKLITLLLAMLCLSLLLFGCDGGGSSGSNTALDPILTEIYIPAAKTVQSIDFSAKTVSAKYKENTVEVDEETVSGTTYQTEELDALIFYSDGTFFISEHKIYRNLETGEENTTLEVERLDERGSYTNTGTWITGTFSVTDMYEWDSDTSAWEADADTYTNITISKAKITLEGDSYTIEQELNLSCSSTSTTGLTSTGWGDISTWPYTFNTTATSDSAGTFTVDVIVQMSPYPTQTLGEGTWTLDGSKFTYTQTRYTPLDTGIITDVPETFTRTIDDIYADSITYYDYTDATMTFSN